MLNLACAFGMWLGRHAERRAWVLPLFLGYVMAFALVARFVGKVTR